jgi:hypothetical protein
MVLILLLHKILQDRFDFDFMHKMETRKKQTKPSQAQPKQNKTKQNKTKQRDRQKIITQL